MEIKKYDAESILEDETFIKIFEMEDTIEREQYIQKNNQAIKTIARVN